MLNKLKRGDKEVEGFRWAWLATSVNRDGRLSWKIVSGIIRRSDSGASLKKEAIDHTAVNTSKGSWRFAACGIRGEIPSPVTVTVMTNTFVLFSNNRPRSEPWQRLPIKSSNRSAIVTVALCRIHLYS